MIEKKTQNLIKQDFEKFMRHRMRSPQGFSLETFVDFGVSLLNFYLGSSLLVRSEKTAAALYLCTLFNGGLKQKIPAEDLQKIADMIVEDQTLDYQMLTPIF